MSRTQPSYANYVVTWRDPNQSRPQKILEIALRPAAVSLANGGDPSSQSEVIDHIALRLCVKPSAISWQDLKLRKPQRR